MTAGDRTSTPGARRLLTGARRCRSVERRLRARLWAALGWVDAGTGVQIGRGCRLRVDGGARVVLGDGVEIDDGTTLAVSDDGVLSIGRGAFVGHHVTLAARRSVVIGDRTFLAELVSIRDHDHDPDQIPASGAMVVTPVHIGADVWVAAKATVLRGSEIGDRAVIAAGCVVRGVVRPGEVVGGVPSRHLRWLDPAFDPDHDERVPNP